MDTITDHSIPGYNYEGYVRVSSFGKDGSYQKQVIMDHTPNISSIKEDRAVNGDDSLNSRNFMRISPNTIISISHPDRILKSQDIEDIDDLLKMLKKKNLKVTFPNIEDLIESYFSLWNKPRLSKYRSLVVRRLAEQFNPKAKRYPLTEDHQEIVRKSFFSLAKLLRESNKRSDDQKFWIVSSWLGKTINKIQGTRGQIGRKVYVPSFGNRSDQIRLFSAFVKLESNYKISKWQGKKCQKPKLELKDFARLLYRMRIHPQKGGYYQKSYLSLWAGSSEYKEFREFYWKALPTIINSLSDPPPQYEYLTVDPINQEYRNVLQDMGYDYFFEDQYETLLNLDNDSSVLYSTRTGGGKNSVPIMYSLMHPEKLVVVVSPLVALMNDYHETLKQYLDQSRLAVFHNGNKDLFGNYYNGLSLGDIKFVLITPEQLAVNEVFYESLQNTQVGLMVIDECHHILVSGSVEFRKHWKPKYLREVFTKLGSPKMLFMSATMGAKVREKISRVFKGQPYKEVQGDLYRPNLNLFSLYFDTSGLKLIALYHLIEAFKEKGYRKGIVFFSSVKSLKRTRKLLAEQRISSLIYYGRVDENSSKDDKKESLEKFRNEKRALMLSTSAFGEGIDINDVQFIIVAEMPGSLIELLQWAGRGGRNGGMTPVVLMVDPQGHEMRIQLILSGKSRRGVRVQTQLYNQLCGFLDQRPDPTFTEIYEHLDSLPE